MNRDNVIDFKTKSPLFNPGLRDDLATGISPYLKDGEAPEKAVGAVEQIICTALVYAARSLATKLATKVANLFTGDTVPSVPK